MHHLLGLSVAIGQTANTEITALQDDVIPRTQNNRYQLPMAMQLLAIYAGSATATRVRLNTASSRVINPRYIYPIEVGLNPTDVPSLEELVDNPFALPAFEELILEGTSGLACGTEVMTALLWISDRIPNVPVGDIYNVRFTSTTAAVANVWTSLTITFETSLPPGQYALVGSDLQGTQGLAHRWLIPGQLWRPGALCRTAIANLPHHMFLRNRLGEWGRFNNTALPNPQVLCTTTTNAWAGLARLIKVA